MIIMRFVKILQNLCGQFENYTQNFLCRPEQISYDQKQLGMYQKILMPGGERGELCIFEINQGICHMTDPPKVIFREGSSKRQVSGRFYE